MSQKENPDPVLPVLPNAQSNVGKKEQVAEMFNRIAKKYDFLNHFLSLGIDKSWRKKAIASLKSIDPKTILDVATGTGDLAIAALNLQPDKIVGVDISEGMLEIGKEKIKKCTAPDTIELKVGDSESLPFQSDAFDAVMCAYGVRNFENLNAGLTEMNRVMKQGGRLAILEFSRPSKFPVKQLFHFYFKFILPTFGKLVSKHNTAYTYLPESVQAFPDGHNFTAILETCGFKNAKARPLSFGITTLYTAEK